MQTNMTNSMKQTVIKNPTWWRRRTSMERGLTLATCVCVAICLALVAALSCVLLQSDTSITNQISPETMPMPAEALSSCKKSPKVIEVRSDNADICLTPGCIHTASNILEYMDTSVEPCDDFYEFACGKFLREKTISDDKSSVTTFSEIGDKLQEQLRAMIEEPIKENEPKPFVLAKNLYKACMNKSAIEARGLQPALDILKRLGGWPVLEGDKWNDGDFDWKESVYRFRNVGYSVDYFLDFSIGIDLKNSTKRIIDIDQASLGLRREYLVKGLDDKLVKAYFDYMVDIAVLFGAPRERAMKELRESLEFEISLANISLPIEKRRNATLLYNPMTISKMQEQFPSVPWLVYFKTLLPESIKITQDEIVIVAVPSFITELEKLMSTTPKRIQANYVMWRAAGASVSYLTEAVRKRQLEYSTVLSGRTEREARWKECIDITSGSLSISTGALYVRKYFNEESKKLALEMVGGIKEEFLKLLQTLDWMDDVTRQSALEKAISMATHIAYPDELLDNKKLEEFYNGLDLSSEEYIGSVLNLTLFGTAYSFKRLREPVNKTDWLSHGRPAVVNAFYSAIENSIQFPAGILQGQFFNNERPRYMNYGAIGFVIGHEITHGFDDQGRQFDKEGNLVDWWAPNTKEAFVKKAQCIIDQYGNYSDPEVGLNLNGINTQGENIADNGGIKEAYLAYQRWVENHGKSEPRLPGLQDYSPQQMFWLSAANTWCSKYRPEAMKLRITTGYHSPGRFRVLGPMSNMDEFASDFNCPKGSKMNPINKCRVW